MFSFLIVWSNLIYLAIRLFNSDQEDYRLNPFQSVLVHVFNLEITSPWLISLSRIRIQPILLFNPYLGDDRFMLFPMLLAGLFHSDVHSEFRCSYFSTDVFIIRELTWHFGKDRCCLSPWLVALPRVKNLVCLVFTCIEFTIRFQISCCLRQRSHSALLFNTIAKIRRFNSFR